MTQQDVQMSEVAELEIALAATTAANDEVQGKPDEQAAASDAVSDERGKSEFGGGCKPAMAEALRKFAKSHVEHSKF